MRGGHNAKPVEQRIAEGNRGKRTIPKTPSIGDIIEHGHEPEPPEYLHEIASAAWARILPLLTRIRMIRTGDLDAFEALCSNIALRRIADEILQRDGITAATERGVQTHPAFRVQQAASQMTLKYCERFGLDPQSRTRLGHAGEAGDGDVEPEDDLPELADLIPIDGGAA